MGQNFDLGPVPHTIPNTIQLQKTIQAIKKVGQKLYKRNYGDFVKIWLNFWELKKMKKFKKWF